MQSYLIANTTLIDANYQPQRNKYIGIRNGRIDYIGDCTAEGYDCVLDGSRYITAPAYVNAHAHSAMTLLRGVGSGLPLDRWLNEAIFPVEAQLTADDIYYGTQLACMEMLRYGTVACNDMYFFGKSMAKAYQDAHFKGNISVSVVSFDPNISFDMLPQYKEYNALFAENTSTVKIDLCIHAEYTNVVPVICQVAEYANGKNAGVHIHLSETQREHNACIARHGMTPTQLMQECGVFKNRTIAAHCVFVDDEDIEILRQNGVFVASCPQSNLKLASGVFDYKKALASKLNLTIGTDGAASNNNLNMTEELRQAVLLAKGISQDAELFSTQQAWRAATLCGALSQGRNDCGAIQIGYKADLAMYPATHANMLPMRDAADHMLFASDGIASMVMCDGEILYKDGEYFTIDKERVIDYATKRHL